MDFPAEVAKETLDLQAVIDALTEQWMDCPTAAIDAQCRRDFFRALRQLQYAFAAHSKLMILHRIRYFRAFFEFVGCIFSNSLSLSLGMLLRTHITKDRNLACSRT